MPARIVVTGGCGFIGSAVVERLVDSGYTVRVIDDLSKPESSTVHLARAGQVEFIRHDLSDASGTRELFDGFDICVNLAAKIGGIGYFHRYPADILSENNKIYSSTFEAAVHCRMQRMVYVSSSMVFESTNKFPSREEDLQTIPMPASAYGFSKLIGEWYCRSFWDQHRLPYTIIRPFNAYGINEAPGEEIGYAHVIPDLAQKLLDGQDPLEILGDGTQTRCFTHVSDIADGLVTAMEADNAINEDFNISNPEEVSVRELAQLLNDLIRPGHPLKLKSVPSFIHDVSRRIPSVEKARTLLGWQARYRLRDRLPEVVRWLENRAAA